MTKTIGFQALLPPSSFEQLVSHIARVASGLGFSMIDGDSLQGVKLARLGGPELALALDTSTQPSQIGCIIGDRIRNAYGHQLLATLLLDVCAGVNAHIGRSFDESGAGTIDRAELLNGPDSLDWIQYWSSSLCSRWTAEKLDRGPFFRVQAYTAGIGIWMGPEPGAVMLSRRHAAHHLGLKLRTIYGRNPRTGEPVEVSWD